MEKKRQNKNDRNTIESECLIPGRVSDAALKKSVLKQPEYEKRAITEYVQSQAKGEKVTHSEKMVTEQVFDRKLDAWDVRTNKERYWVITNPTNLYSQELFPSLDYTLSFHIGITERIMSRESREPPKGRLSRFESAWRRWSQAAEALDRANEAEDFQAVGMRCRECLLSFIRALASKRMVPEGQIAPKVGDFVHWSELTANNIAPGESAEEIRGYLKSMSRSTWQLVNWLTHSTDVALFDGLFAVDAVEKLIVTFEMALIRYEKGVPTKCPNCSSYQLISDYRSGSRSKNPDMFVCKSCGWSGNKMPSRAVRKNNGDSKL